MKSFVKSMADENGTGDLLRIMSKGESSMLRTV